MVRKKVPKPQQLAEAEQQAGTWSLADAELPLPPSRALPEDLGHLGSDVSDVDQDLVSRPNLQKSLPSASSSGDHINTASTSNATSSHQDEIHDPFSLEFKFSSTKSSDILTVDSEDSASDIQELPVIKPILQNRSANSRSPRKCHVRKAVVFDIADDLSDSSDDEDYVPVNVHVPIPRQRRGQRRLPFQHRQDDDEHYNSASDSNEDGIEVISENVFNHSYDFASDDDIVLDYDGYEVAKKAKERKKKGEIQYYGDFEKVLDECMLTVKICRDDAKDAVCLFSEVKFVLFDDLDNGLWKMCDSCWLYICPDIDSSAVYFEWISDKVSSKKKKKVNPNKKKNKPDCFKHYKVNGFVNDALWRGFANSKHFHLRYSAFNLETKEVSVSVYLLLTALKDLQHPSEVVTSLRGLSDTVCLLYNIDLPVHNGVKKLKHDFEVLYKAVKKNHQGKKYFQESVQHPALIPALRPYQQSAVQWMLYKENVCTQVEEQQTLNLHCLFVQLTALDGTKLYYNKHGGYFSKEMPLEILPTPGGILADEMGLGKTVEVLACILNNPSGPIPRPGYLEPVVTVIPKKNQRKRSRKSINDDIVTLESDSEDSSDSSAEAPDMEEESDDQKTLKQVNGKHKRKNVIESDEEYDVEEDSKCVDNSRTKYPRNNRKKRAKMNDDCSEGKSCKQTRQQKVSSDECEDGDVKPDRPRCTGRRKRRFSYSDMDDFCFDASSSEAEEDYSQKSVKVTRQSRRGNSESSLSNSAVNVNDVPPVKKPRRSQADEEIHANPFWSTIERVILNVCWKEELVKYKKEGSYKEFRDYLRKIKKDPTYMMSIRERLQMQYDQATTTYSTAGAAAKDYHKNFRQSFFKTKVEQTTYFECICGVNENVSSDSGTVQCTSCGLHQHADCVVYDTSDPYRGPYFCPHCWTQQSPVASGATLIVAPSAISYQWVDELKKHVRRRALRVLVYRGVAHQGYVQPRSLAAFDLVVTSYETLSRELNYVDLPHSNSQQGRRFRHPKRFMAVPTPLLSVLWWRCVLDEAQLVEATTARTAHMALRLHARHRWCVTGTPVQRSIEDLQGLLLFLGVDPWGMDTWWSRVMYEAYCHGDTSPLHALVADVMWRNTKRDVIHQIDLPPQTETIHWVQFSGVEDHFYRQLHGECSRDARTRLAKYTDSVKLSDLDRKTLTHLLQPLLRLRQACNHPQVVRGAFTRLNSNRPLSMDEVMQRLVERTATQAEDAHRLLVVANNGLAAVAVIRERFQEAADHYRTVLASAAEHAQHLRTDSLQRLHALHNLHELLQAGHEGIPKTLGDEDLPQRAADIRNKYMQQYSTKVSDAKKECEQNSKQIVEIEATRHTKNDWWLSALQAFNDDFVLEVRDELISRYSRFEENKCLLHQVYSKPQLRNVLQIRTKLLHRQRLSVLAGVKSLADVDPKELLDAAIDCHLRPTEREPPQCKICAIHGLFIEYEKNLFFMSDQKHDRTTDKSKETADVKEKAQVKETTRKGNWGQSEVERILKYLQTRSLSKVSQEVYEDAQTHVKVLDGMKKEFKNYRIYWRCIFDLVSGLDEVNMATLRLRVRYPDEEMPPKAKKIRKKNEGDNLLNDHIEAPRYILEDVEVDEQEMKFRSDKIVQEMDLRVKLGQLLYLQNLQKKDLQQTGGKNPEPCPICQNPLGEEWAVLLCGHFFCRPCIDLITSNLLAGLQQRGGAVKCPMCRQPTLVRDVSYVDTKAPTAEEKQEELLDVKVVGSLSSKTEEVVRVMLRIKADDPHAKVLVFSSWNEVLEVIADGLAQNGIPYRMLHKGNKFQLHLSSFRSRSEITALLLPITSGANGLNLTEAHHVFLVDPLLNPAAELQAVGRVHRMGQTKPTVVHRFLVRGTIEHRMFRILGSLHQYPGNQPTQSEAAAGSSSEKKMEEGNLDEIERDGSVVKDEYRTVNDECNSLVRSCESVRKRQANIVDEAQPSTSLASTSSSVPQTEGDDSTAMERDGEESSLNDLNGDAEPDENDVVKPDTESSLSEELSLTIGDLKQLFACLDDSNKPGGSEIPSNNTSRNENLNIGDNAGEENEQTEEEASVSVQKEPSELSKSGNQIHEPCTSTESLALASVSELSEDTNSTTASTSKSHEHSPSLELPGPSSIRDVLADLPGASDILVNSYEQSIPSKQSSCTEQNLVAGSTLSVQTERPLSPNVPNTVVDESQQECTTSLCSTDKRPTQEGANSLSSNHAVENDSLGHREEIESSTVESPELTESADAPKSTIASECPSGQNRALDHTVVDAPEVSVRLSMDKSLSNAPEVPKRTSLDASDSNAPEVPMRTSLDASVSSAPEVSIQSSTEASDSNVPDGPLPALIDTCVSSTPKVSIQASIAASGSSVPDIPFQSPITTLENITTPDSALVSTSTDLFIPSPQPQDCSSQPWSSIEEKTSSNAANFKNFSFVGNHTNGISPTTMTLPLTDSSSSDAVDKDQNGSNDAQNCSTQESLYLLNVMDKVSESSEVAKCSVSDSKSISRGNEDLEQSQTVQNTSTEPECSPIFSSNGEVSNPEEQFVMTSAKGLTTSREAPQLSTPHNGSNSLSDGPPVNSLPDGAVPRLTTVLEETHHIMSHPPPIEEPTNAPVDSSPP